MHICLCEDNENMDLEKAADALPIKAIEQLSEATMIAANPSAPPLSSANMPPTPSIVSRNGDDFENRAQDLADFETSWLISQVRQTGTHGVVLDTDPLAEPAWAKDLLAPPPPPPPIVANKAKRTVNLVTGPMMGRGRGDGESCLFSILQSKIILISVT